MNAEQLQSDLEQSFKKQFPNGYYSSVIKKSVHGDHIVIRLGLIGCLDDCTNRIRENDPMYDTILIWVNNDRYESTKIIGTIAVNPTNKMYAMEHKKLRGRTIKGDDTKTLKGFDKLFKDLRLLVNENKENIYHADLIQKYL